MVVAPAGKLYTRSIAFRATHASKLAQLATRFKMSITMNHYLNLAASTACQCNPWHCSCAERAPTVAVGHTPEQCVGNCRVHSLVKGEAGAIWVLMNAGFNGVWGSIDVEETEERLSSETPEQAAARLAEVARLDAEAKAAIADRRVFKKEEKWCAKGGAMKFRVPKPCKYVTLLLSRTCAGCDKLGIKSILPAGDDVCHMVRSAFAGARQRECGEVLAGCWNHEKTHSCIYVHPDEPQWADACSGCLDVRADNRLVFCRATDPAATRMVGKPQGRFAALGAAPQPKPVHGGPAPQAPWSKPKPSAGATPRDADEWTTQRRGGGKGKKDDW